MTIVQGYSNHLGRGSKLPNVPRSNNSTMNRFEHTGCKSHRAKLPSLAGPFFNLLPGQLAAPVRFLRLKRETESRGPTMLARSTGGRVFSCSGASSSLSNTEGAALAWAGARRAPNETDTHQQRRRPRVANSDDINRLQGPFSAAS